MGLDSTKEEMSTNEQVFLDRGMATLAFDGPGQGEAEYQLPIRPDYEAPVSAVIDWLELRADLDSTRVGLWGVSLGGYYAPRAAAFEKRILACISLTGPFDFAEAFERAPTLTRFAFTIRSHVETEAEASKIAANLNLSEIAKMIECPIYIVGGALDRVIPFDHSARLAEAVSGPVTLNMVEDGTHVVNNRPYKYRPQSADWMAKYLFA
jgi:2,6-dihydroxypseudooxynicotine hydrolase